MPRLPFQRHRLFFSGAAALAPLLALLALLLLVPGTATAETLVVIGDDVHLGTGDILSPGAVVILDGKIAAVGAPDALELPAGARTLRAAVVTPGLVDARSVAGLGGYLNQSQDQDQLERSEAVQPELRALDAYDARETLVDWLRSYGITTLHTGHGPGAVISGQTLIAKTHGRTVDDAVIVPVATVAASLGDNALREGKESPGTRGKTMALLRQALHEAQAYGEKLADEERAAKLERSLRHEALLPVLAGEVPLLVHAQRHQDIASALRLAREFDGLRVILDGAAESYLLLDEIREAGVPVIVHPTMARPIAETQHLSMATAATLAEAGIPFAFQSGFESYVPKTRVALFEAGVAAGRGLDSEHALRALTLDAAKILGIDDRVGSLEVGKDGDVALYDGDPLEYTSHCVAVIIDGKVVVEEGEGR
ncbi:MAG: amidohydrolase family protein [Acidobacteriota bacterium]